MLGFAKSLSCYVNACSHKRIVEFVLLAFGRNSLRSEIEIFMAMTPVLAPYFCIII